LVGLMGYEAQIAGVPDYTNSIVKNWIIKSLKSYSLNEISSKRKLFNSIIEEFKIRLDFVNGGGTGSVSSTIKDDSVTEVTIGSGFYSPTLFDKYTNFRYLPAAGFALEVTRRPDQTHWTCHGGGYIGSGSTGKEKNPTPYLPENLKITDIEGAGEVQTPILDNSCETIQLGDPVFFRHAKAGELCERFNELFLISNGRVIDKALTYRGQRKCFL
jgi:D-serine deaminase-like pyridoxal phosphate-dependent protein